MAAAEIVKVMVMKNKNRRTGKKGNLFTGLGLLLIVAALFLTGYNIWDDYRAGQASQAIVGEVAQLIPTESTEAHESGSAKAEEPQTAETEVPNYLKDPTMKMPEKEINGQMYIGVVEIPTLELELPIISEWSDARLKISPCRYVGSAYLNNMILSGHSYKNHFRYIRKLVEGDRVIFTDMDGNRFEYEVTLQEVILAEDVEGMLAGEWDLTLFTCTPGGKSRNTVRCRLVEEENK